MKNPLAWLTEVGPRPWWWNPLMVILAICICAAVCGIGAMLYLFLFAQL